MLPILEVILNHRELTAADIRIFAAIATLGSETSTKAVLELTGYILRQYRYSTRRLIGCGLIHCPGVQILAPKVQTSAPESMVEAALPVQETAPMVQGFAPKVQGFAPKVQGFAPKTHHDMMHDDDVINELNFFDKAGLQKLLALPHLTYEFAQAWRRFKESKDNYGWGQIKNPVGYIYREMQRGNWPVVQEELPAGIIEFSPEQLKTLGSHLAELVSNGGTLGKDGIWR